MSRFGKLFPVALALVVAALSARSGGADAPAPEAAAPAKAGKAREAYAAQFAVGDWPCWRGVNGDGVSIEKDWNPRWPAQGPKKLWEAEVGRGYSPVSVVGSRAYTMGRVTKDEGVLWCFDAPTGNVLWKHPYRSAGGGSGYPGPRSQPTIDGDRLYAVDIQGHFVCLKAATGEPVWEHDLRKDFAARGHKNYGHCENPLILGNTLILATGAPPATVMAFDKMTGKLLWKGGEEPGGYSTPTPYLWKSRQCLAVQAGTHLLGMDASNGAVLWRYPWEPKLQVAVATPIASEGKVFISANYGHGAALLQVTDGPPKELWRNKNMSNHFMTCVLYQGHLYGFTPEGSHSVSTKTVLRCLDFETGQVRWSDKGLGIGTVIVADGKLIALGDEGDLVVAETTPEAYRPVSKAKVLNARCWTVPTLARGRLYCRDEPGHLVCLDVSKAPPR